MVAGLPKLYLEPQLPILSKEIMGFLFLMRRRCESIILVERLHSRGDTYLEYFGYERNKRKFAALVLAPEFAHLRVCSFTSLHAKGALRDLFANPPLVV